MQARVRSHMRGHVSYTSRLYVRDNGPLFSLECNGAEMESWNVRAAATYRLDYNMEITARCISQGKGANHLGVTSGAIDPPSLWVL